MPAEKLYILSYNCFAEASGLFSNQIVGITVKYTIWENLRKETLVNVQTKYFVKTTFENMALNILFHNFWMHDPTTLPSQRS